jgi:hypothetical protein
MNKLYVYSFLENYSMFDLKLEITALISNSALTGMRLCSS